MAANKKAQEIMETLQTLWVDNLGNVIVMRL